MESGTDISGTASNDGSGSLCGNWTSFECSTDASCVVAEIDLE